MGIELQYTNDLYILIEILLSPFAQLLLVLHAWSSSLTDITIDYAPSLEPDLTMGYRIYDIFDACPHLVSLSISHGLFYAQFVSKKYPKLKKLELINTRAGMDSMSMWALLESFPQLRALRITPAPASGILRVIPQSCPSLTHVFLTSNTPSYPPNMLDTADSTTGLRMFMVSGRRHLATIKGSDLERYMVQHADTLETIDIDHGFHCFTLRLLQRPDVIQKVTFRQLRHLRYGTFFNGHSNSWVVWMIQHAPRLESVETVNGAYDAPEPETSAFKRIGLEADDHQPQEIEDRFITHHLELGQYSNLKEISITMRKHARSEPWIFLIAQLTQLTHLELRCHEPHVVMDAVIAPFLAHIASQCRSLEHLAVHFYDSPIDCDRLMVLSHHNTLITLVLNGTQLRGDVSMLSSFVHLFHRLHVLHLMLDTINPAYMEILKTGAFQCVCTRRARNAALQSGYNK